MSFIKNSRTRIATTTVWQTRNPVLPNGYFGFEIADSDTSAVLIEGVTYYRVKIGDGVTRWNDLSYSELNATSSEPAEPATGVQLVQIGEATVNVGTGTGAGEDYYGILYLPGYTVRNTRPTMFTMELEDPNQVPALINDTTKWEMYFEGGGQYITDFVSDKSNNYHVGLDDLIGGHVMIVDLTVAMSSYPVHNGTGWGLFNQTTSPTIVWFDTIGGTALSTDPVPVVFKLYGYTA